MTFSRSLRNLSLLFCTLQLFTSQLIPHAAQAQHVGLVGNIGADRWYGGQHSLRADAGVFHSLQMHPSIALRSNLMLGYGTSRPGTPELRSRHHAAIILQVAPTVMLVRGMFFRAGAEMQKPLVHNTSSIENAMASPPPFRIHGIVATGIQHDKWELALQLHIGAPETHVIAPLSGSHITVARLLHSGSRKLPADRRWTKPLLPWQEIRWSDRSREWRNR